MGENCTVKVCKFKNLVCILKLTEHHQILSSVFEANPRKNEWQKIIVLLPPIVAVEMVSTVNTLLLLVNNLVGLFMKDNSIVSLSLLPCGGRSMLVSRRVRIVVLVLASSHNNNTRLVETTANYSPERSHNIMSNQYIPFDGIDGYRVE